MAISSSSTGLRPGVCTSTTRPTTPYTGQIIYETDTGYLRVWDGAAWDYLSQKQDYSQGLGAGKILQIAQSTTTSVATTSSTTYADTALSISFTCQSTTNKVLAVLNAVSFSDAAGTEGSLRLMRGSTEVAVIQGLSYSSAGNAIGTPAFTYLDSPATTSATTYKIQFKRFGGSGTFYLSPNSSLSTLTLMEVAA